MTDDGSGSNDPVTEGTIGDKDKLENRSNNEVTVTTLTSNELGDNDPTIKGTTENKNAIGIDTIENKKELKSSRKDQEATEYSSNKGETTNKSSFRIISIINTASTEEGEKITELEDDITEATDSGAVTGDSMLTNDPSKRPLAPNTKNTEDNNDDSNPQVEHYHKDTGKADNVPKKNVPVC